VGPSRLTYAAGVFAPRRPGLVSPGSVRWWAIGLAALAVGANAAVGVPLVDKSVMGLDGILLAGSLALPLGSYLLLTRTARVRMATFAIDVRRRFLAPAAVQRGTYLICLCWFAAGILQFRGTTRFWAASPSPTSCSSRSPSRGWRPARACSWTRTGDAARETPHNLGLVAADLLQPAHIPLDLDPAQVQRERHRPRRGRSGWLARAGSDSNRPVLGSTGCHEGSCASGVAAVESREDRHGPNAGRRRGVANALVMECWVTGCDGQSRVSACR
jgi:hypothetical protein